VFQQHKFLFTIPFDRFSVTMDLLLGMYVCVVGIPDVLILVEQCWFRKLCPICVRGRYTFVPLFKMFRVYQQTKAKFFLRLLLWVLVHITLPWYLICHMFIGDSRWGFGLDIGFIDLFNTQLMITLNYSAITDFCTIQIMTAHATFFPARNVFTSSCLVTAPTMAIPLVPVSSPLWMAAPFQLY
jgi:hypothetical protein